jgi:WD40 repeat protein
VTATGAIASARMADGALRGTSRYRGEAYAIVSHGDHCALETYAGKHVADLPGDCRSVRLSTGDRPGHETAIVIDRSGAVDVWSPAGIDVLPALTAQLVERSEGGLVAVADDRTIAIWDHGTRRPGPPPHELPIQGITWSAGGWLASRDEDTVHVWDPASGHAHVLSTPHVVAAIWGLDGALYTSDGRVVQQWHVDLAHDADAVSLRARIAQTTTARVVGDRVETPGPALLKAF